MRRQIVSGTIMGVRAAETDQPRLELEIAPEPTFLHEGPPPRVWCSAPAYSDDGKPLPELADQHLELARTFFVGRPAELEIDENGKIHAQVLWRRDDGT